MNILDIPFHRALGFAAAPPPWLLQLNSQPEHQNHLGTIHASVLIALAEAGSGVLLMQHLSDGTEAMGTTVLPVIRRIDAKFHQAGRGLVFARGELDNVVIEKTREDLARKSRAKITVPMQVMDAQETLLLSVNYEWFIQKLAG